MSYIIQHTCLGFCWLDLVSLLVLIAVIAVAFLRRRDIKKEEKDLEEELSAFYAEQTVEVKAQG